MNQTKMLKLITAIFFIASSLFTSAMFAADKEIIAVHNFNVSPALKKFKISGWWISEIMENELVQTGKCRVVTRARISRVLKEKNISSSSTIAPQTLGKIIGAQYIVTGQAEFSDHKLIVTANMINIAQKTGEITESYEISSITQPGQVAAKLAELVEELAIMLTMTPGEFLDLGLSLMQSGDYTSAVEIFKYFEREAKLAKIISLIDMVDQKNLKAQAATINLNNKTPGEALDYGIKLMHQGKQHQAALVFHRLQQSRMARKINNLMKVAKAGAKNQNEQIDKIIAIARTKFKHAITNRNKAELDKSPATLCDDAVTELQAFLSEPKIFISKSKRSQIKQLISEIEQFREKLFNGPNSNKQWLLPRIKITLIPIKAGKFKMRNELPVEEREEPEYTVALSRPFWIGKTEISAGQFLYYLKQLKLNSRAERYEIDREINFTSNYCPLNKHYRLKRGFSKKHPMTEISWRGANKFCKWLNSTEQAAERLPEGYEYRLPTEAEWEYCCRAGSDKAFAFGDDTGQINNYAWYRSNSNRASQQHGGKKPNIWGVYDMHGNVWEWCNDWYGENFLVADTEDPIGPAASNDNCKVLRGGSFTSSPLDLRCGTRYLHNYKRGRKNVGFRVVCAPEL